MPEAAIDLYRLAQFVAVTDHESLSAAADHLHLTQQALSTAMRRLERALGVGLFERSGRRLTLTAPGRKLREGAPLLLSAATALADATRQVAAGSSPPFVVGHTPAITAEEIFTIIEPLRSALPELSVTARQMFPDELQRGLLDRTIDVGFRRGATTPPDLAGTVTGYDELRVAVRAGHPLAGQARIALTDIAAYPLVVWAPPTFSFYTDFLVSACRRAGFEPALVVNKTQGTPPVTAVADNDYVALVTAPSGTALQGRVEVRPLVDPPLVPVQALWLPHTLSEPRSLLLARRSAG
ncbi:LysR family transcriptional regulator [Mycobacterium sp. 1164966.3]|uniref:LysR substrate-binding domain-containing protein n=1 Tax=Mycobacterium sp. 1164966.3 TaxID=1856861 RepID=UPI0009EE25D4|nr:LysR family transcriptional regulator [Mycobacterium sp. 1164966.3]